MGKKKRKKLARADRPSGTGAPAKAPKLGRWAPLVLVVLPLLIYANSLNNAFHYDDFHSLVDNPHIRKLENIPSFFTSARTTSIHAERGHYRPVLFSTYALSYALGGYDYDPTVFRLANLILHILNGLLLFAVFRRVSGNTAVAFYAALLFAVHPLNTESVNYISCRSNVLATTFYLAGVGLFVGYSGSAPTRRRTAFYAGSLGCFGLGLLTKEIVITLPAILMLLDILILSPRPDGAGGGAKISLAPQTSLSGQGASFDVKTLFRRHLAFWMVAGFYLFLIFAVGLKPMYERHGVLYNLLVQTKAMAFYLRLLVFPRGLSVAHGFDMESTLSAAFWISLFIIGGSLFLTWRLRRRCGLLSFAILWYFIALLPTSSVIALHIPVNEHRTYLPGVGFAVAVAFLFGLITTKSKETRARLRPAPTLGRLGQALSKLAVPLFAVVVGIFSVAVFARNQTWKTAITLWKDAAKKYPDNPHAHETLGLEYSKLGDLEKAEREFLLAVRRGGVSKALAKPYNELGIIYAKRKEYESAIEHYTLSAELDPRAIEPHLNLGMLYSQQGQHEKALPYYEKVIALNPHHAIAHAALGNVYGKIGNLQRAEEELRLAARYGDSKTFAESHNGLGIIFATRNEYENAIKHFTLSIKADADAIGPYLNLGMLYSELGQHEKALPYYEKTIALNPNVERPYHDLVRIYLDLREADKASGVFQEMKKRGFNLPEDLRKHLDAAMKSP
ncbi:MAG: tetratricopeptide repeat protein [Acidobacteriota bacterium]|nr:MAG: tetratricopeptide repeat protein [Acidobacteriota bacterium]